MSLLPSAGQNTNEYPTFIPQKTFQTGSLPSSILTPQQTLQLDIQVDYTVDAYLLRIDGLTFYNRITSYSRGFYNDSVTTLQAFLQGDQPPVAKTWLNTQSVHDSYTPGAVTNITLVISNPNPSSVQGSYRAVISSQVGPAAKMRTITEVAVPLGIVMTVPWFLDIYNRRKTSGPPNRNLGTG